MRTTVDLPDELMKKAKMKAIEEGITLKELLKRSIEKELIEKEADSAEPWKDLRGMGSAKNLKPEDTAFDTDWDPESEFFFQVNEPKSDKD